MTLQRWKLTVEYDGTDFYGWQRQEDGVKTVQGTLEDAINSFCQQRLTLHVAGRTDAGVHARGQVCHFDLDYGARPLTAGNLVKALNAHLRTEPVCVVQAEAVDQDFHARFSATNKLYIYRILNRSAQPVLDRGHVWHIRKPLDVLAMQRASQYLLGTHDFSSFRDAQCQAKSPVRTLDRLDVRVHGADEYGGVDIHIHAEARSFLHHQVRNMVGSLATVGIGKWQAEDMKAALDACDRTKTGPTAPAEGLALIRVDYA